MLEPAGETLLYYAAGGGLGHITRALAILQALPQGSFPARVLCSSRLSPLVREAVGPLPLDCPPEEILSSRRAYYRYLRDYLALYRVGILVLDCFPWGLIGEWAELGEHIPRLLIARSLKWGAYRERLDSREGPPPRASLVLEPLEEEYHRLLKGWGDTALLADPVLPADFDVSETSPPSFKKTVSFWFTAGAGRNSISSGISPSSRRRREASATPCWIRSFRTVTSFPPIPYTGNTATLPPAGATTWRRLPAGPCRVRASFCIPFPGALTISRPG